MARRLRILADAAFPPTHGRSYPDGEPLRFANGNDLRFEILAAQHGQVLTGLDLATVSLCLKDAGAVGGDPYYFIGADAVLSDTVTAQSWEAGTDQTAVIEIPGSSTNIPAGSYLLTITCFTEDSTALTLAIAQIAVLEDGDGDGSQMAIPEAYYTQRQADLRFAPISIVDLVESIANSQAAGHIGYMTLADLEADLEHPAGTLAEVTNDLTDANNGVYIKEGAISEGSWTKSSNDFAARLNNLENSVPDTVAQSIEDSGLIGDVAVYDNYGRRVLLAGEAGSPMRLEPVLSIDTSNAEVYGKFGVVLEPNIRTPGVGDEVYLAARVGNEYRGVRIETGPVPTPEDDVVYIEGNMRLPGDVDFLFTDPAGRILTFPGSEPVAGEAVSVPHDLTQSNMPHRRDNFLLGTDSAPTAPAQVLLHDDAVSFWISQPQGLVLPSGNILHGFVDNDGDTCVVHYNVTTAVATKTVLFARTDDIDDHNTPALCIMPDGKIMASWSQHASDVYNRVKISTVNEPINSGHWGALNEQIVGSQYSYASLQVSNGTVYLLFRYTSSGQRKWTLGRWDGADWVDFEHILDGMAGGDGNHYAHFWADGDKLWFAMGTASWEFECDIVCFYLDTAEGKWYSPNGTFLKNYQWSPPGGHEIILSALPDDCFVYRYSASPLTVLESYDKHIPQGRPWMHDIKVKDGVPYVVWSVSDFQGNNYSPLDRLASQRIQYYWAAFLDGKWLRRFCANGGWGLNKASAVYAPGICVHPDKPWDVVISTNERYPFRTDRRTSGNLSSLGHHELFYGEYSSAGWNWRALTEASSFALLNAEGSVGCIRPQISSDGIGAWCFFQAGYYRKFSNPVGSWTPTANWDMALKAIQLT